MKKFLLLFFALCGCSTYKVSFTSSPPGAYIVKDGSDICQTPCQTTLERNSNDEIIIFRFKDKSQSVILNKNVSGRSERKNYHVIFK